MTLRITGGIWRGRRLEAAPASRPTQERVREALFSSWAPRVIGADVLDLFAGSGAVGFEALSRGAASCGFVESRDACVRVLVANAATLGIDDASIARLELPAGLERLPAAWPRRFDLVFADPPYGFDAYGELVDSIAPRLEPGGEVAVEHSTRTPLGPEAGELTIDRERRYGETALTFLRLEPAG
ncbi:MAG TPA: 16S rRNA (guanine(966)-N(2))-methyltransferase RsmD [Thermoanaerobaculia bacterium]|nr:16S rRNA (guanine(966)-N(2))-methyltransferase RsmD [Thermoanaerobaculia bacterium]